MKHLGQISIFHHDKGYGFFSCTDPVSTNYFWVFVHIKACRKLKPDLFQWVVCEFEPSKRYAGKYEASKVSSLSENKEFLEFYISSASEQQRRSLFENYSLFTQLVSLWKPEVDVTSTEKHIDELINSFNLDSVVESITGELKLWTYKKPGDDDSFRAVIVIEAARTEDAFIDRIMPIFSKEVCRDSGFYSCYKMRDEYIECGARDADEAQIPRLVLEFKKEFRDAYDKDSHKKYLIQQLIREREDDMRRQIANSLRNFGSPYKIS